MAQTKDLLKINYYTLDYTDMHFIGEVNHEIYESELDKYLKDHGNKGYRLLMLEMCFLISYIREKWIESEHAKAELTTDETSK